VKLLLLPLVGRQINHLLLPPCLPARPICHSYGYRRDLALADGCEPSHEQDLFVAKTKLGPGMQHFRLVGAIDGSYVLPGKT